MTTQFFYDLTPDRVLDAVESTGLVCTGRALALNSMENRVYEVEIELEDGRPKRSPSDAFRIAKFYRPGRWSQQQILEEHRFLQDLANEEIPVVAPLTFADGSTLRQMPGTADDVCIWYAVFPKIGGRSPEELVDDQIARVGRLLARMHNVGAAGSAPHRLELTPETYGRKNLAYLQDGGFIPLELAAAYRDTVQRICDIGEDWFEGVRLQRIHGDGHFGNLLWGPTGPFWVDFDDMVRGPVVQDLWLIMPGRDEWACRQLNTLLDAYDQMRPFDRKQLRLIEVLRALRFVHFSAWIARRWQDPAFPRSFPHFGTIRYWQEQLADLREQLQILGEISAGRSPWDLR